MTLVVTRCALAALLVLPAIAGPASGAYGKLVSEELDLGFLLDREPEWREWAPALDGHALFSTDGGLVVAHFSAKSGDREFRNPLIVETGDSNRRCIVMGDTYVWIYLRDCITR